MRTSAPTKFLQKTPSPQPSYIRGWGLTSVQLRCSWVRTFHFPRILLPSLTLLAWVFVRNSLSSVSSNGSPAYSILTFLGSGRIAHMSLFGTGFRILNISHCQGPSPAVTFRLLTTRGFPPSRTGVRLLRRLPSSLLRSIPAVRDGSSLLSTLDSLLLSVFIVHRSLSDVNPFCVISL